MRPDEGLRCEATDPVERPLAVGLGLQLAVLSLNSAVLFPTIVFRAAGAEAFLLWAVFAGMMACGIVTAVQAIRVGRFGAGYQSLHGVSSPFIAVCVAALVQGGPPMLAALVLVSGLAQAAFSERLALLHRILTPVVTGTVIMLLPVTVMPILLRMLNELPAGAPAGAAPLSALATLATTVGLHLKGTGRLRLWAPLAGVAAGALVGGFFGIYEVGLVADAAWLGLPAGRPPGLDVGFRSRVLGASAGLPVHRARRGHQVGRRGRGHPARIVAPPARGGLSRRAGRGGGRGGRKRPGRSGGRDSEHPASHAGRCDRDDGSGPPAAWASRPGSR